MIVKHSVHNFPIYLIQLFNSCIHSSVFPLIWKRTKNDKPSEDPSSYRPICLIDTFGKLFESIIIYYLLKFSKRSIHLKIGFLIDKIYIQIYIFFVRWGGGNLFGYQVVYVMFPLKLPPSSGCLPIRNCVNITSNIYIYIYIYVYIYIYIYIYI